MRNWWKRLTPRQLRWLAAAVGAVFVLLLLMSSFFSDLSVGLGFAIDQSQIELLPHTISCPAGKLCSSGATTTDHLIDLPVKAVFGLSVLLAGWLLYIASSRQRQISN